METPCHNRASVSPPAVPLVLLVVLAGISLPFFGCQDDVGLPRCTRDATGLQAFCEGPTKIEILGATYYPSRISGTFGGFDKECPVTIDLVDPDDPAFVGAEVYITSDDGDLPRGTWEFCALRGDMSVLVGTIDATTWVWSDKLDGYLTIETEDNPRKTFVTLCARVDEPEGALAGALIHIDRVQILAVFF